MKAVSNYACVKSLALACGLSALVSLSAACHAASITYTTSLDGLYSEQNVESSKTLTGGTFGSPNPHTGNFAVTLPKYSGPLWTLKGVTFTLDANMAFSNTIESTVPFVSTTVTTNFNGHFALTQPQLGSLGYTVPNDSIPVSIPGYIPILQSPMSRTVTYKPLDIVLTQSVAASNFGAFVGSGNIAGLNFSDTDTSTSNAEELAGIGDFNFWTAGTDSVLPSSITSVTYTYVPEPGVTALFLGASASGLSLLRRRRAR